MEFENFNDLKEVESYINEQTNNMFEGSEVYLTYHESVESYIGELKENGAFDDEDMLLSDAELFNDRVLLEINPTLPPADFLLIDSPNWDGGEIFTSLDKYEVDFFIKNLKIRYRELFKKTIRKPYR